MKRPTGVTLSAVVLALISLAQLPLALGMVLAATFVPRAAQSNPAVPPTPSWLPVFYYLFAGVFLALAAWGIVTTIGLARLRRWARYSILVIGGGMAVIGLFSMLSILALLAFPFPTPAGMDPAHAQSAHLMVRAVFGCIALLYALMLATGAWWLVYFNLKPVRQVFAGAADAPAECRRPLLVSVIAALSILGALCCLLMAFLPLPGVAFGWVLTGWGKAAFYLTYAVLQAAAGVGLWKLEEWARRLTLGLLAFGIVHSFVYLLRPALMLHAAAMVNQSLHVEQPAMDAHWLRTLYAGSSCLTIVFLVALMTMLHIYRSRFGRPAQPSAAEPTALP